MQKDSLKEYVMHNEGLETARCWTAKGLASKKLLLTLVVVVGTSFFVNSKFLQPSLDSAKARYQLILKSQQSTIMAFDPNNVVDVLFDLAKVDHSDLWIHDLKINDRNLSLVVRSMNLKSIENYVHSVSGKRLSLKSMTAENIKDNTFSREDLRKSSSKKDKNIPLQLRLHMERLNLISKKKKRGSANDAKQLFAYEADIELSIK